MPAPKAFSLTTSTAEVPPKSSEEGKKTEDKPAFSFGVSASTPAAPAKSDDAAKADSITPKVQFKSPDVTSQAEKSKDEPAAKPSFSFGAGPTKSDAAKSPPPPSFKI